MLVKEYLANYFKADFIDCCLYEGEIENEIDNESSLFIHDVDREGLESVLCEDSILVETYQYWLGEDEDSPQYREEIYQCDNSIIHADLNIGAFRDDGADASGVMTITIFANEEEAACKFIELRSTIKKGIGRTLSSPMVSQYEYLGKRKELSDELAHVTEEILKKLNLDERMATIPHLWENISTLRIQCARDCIASVFNNVAPSLVLYDKDMDGIRIGNEGIFPCNELIESIEGYQIAAKLFDTKNTAVSVATLRESINVLRSL